jgi:hypothetical protein
MGKRWDATPPTSLAAYESIVGALGDIQRQVLEAHRVAGPHGLTSEELAAKFPTYDTSTPRVRVAELLRLGMLVETGETRMGSRGRKMLVRFATKPALPQLEMFA